MAIRITMTEDRKRGYIAADHIDLVHIYEGLKLLFKQYVEELGEQTPLTNYEDLDFYVKTLEQIGQMLYFYEVESEVL